LCAKVISEVNVVVGEAGDQDGGKTRGNLIARSRTEKTLLSTLNALFKKELAEQQLSELFGALRKRGFITVDGSKVSYALPDS
jgi:hypothetical protein